MRSEQRVVLVTGASSGLGRTIALALAADGHRVFGTSRERGTAGQRAASAVHMLTMDVTDEAAVDAAITAVTSAAGRLDVVVNNAGYGIAGAVEDTSVAEAAAQLDANLLGTHRVCRRALPILRAQGGGRIINVSSLAGLVPLPFQAFYSASKFAVEAYTEALRIELRPFGVHVSLIEPGDFATGFTAKRRIALAATPASPYYERMQRAVGIMARDEQANVDLSPVAHTVRRILAAPRPRLRYPVATRAQRTLVALKPFLPAAWVERLLAATYGVG